LFVSSARFDEAIIGAKRDSIYPKFAVKPGCDKREGAVPAGCRRTARRMRALHMMKIVLKYGIAVTVVIAAWVALKHFALHLEGRPAQIADLAVFNLSALAGLELGIRAKRKANGGWLTFLEGWKTGISIAVTYAILTSLYFLVLLALVGPKLMQQEGEISYLKAFLGASVGFALFGTVLSAVIALVLKRQPGMTINEC
jgi:hypothetical protein